MTCSLILVEAGKRYFPQRGKPWSQDACQLPGPGRSVNASGANTSFPTFWAGRLCARLWRQHCFSNSLDRATLCKTRVPTLFFQLSGPGDSVQDSGANIVFPTIWTEGLRARLGRQHCFSNYLDRATLCKTRAPTLFFQLSGPGGSLQDSGANTVFPTSWVKRLCARLWRQHCFPTFCTGQLCARLPKRKH